jgi:uncharacterized membrane protein YvbJ
MILSNKKISIKTILFISFIIILAIFLAIILIFNLYFQEKQMGTQRDLILKNAVMHAYTIVEMKYEGYSKRNLELENAQEQVKNIIL